MEANLQSKAGIEAAPMNLSIFVVDAFADRPLAGNPAAVCPLDAWLPASTMQAIASEMNLSETVFFVPDPDRDGFGIRWFTPTREVDLIGHATLAAGFLVLHRLQPDALSVRFFSNDDSELVVTRDGASLALEMRALPPQEIAPPATLARGLGRKPKAVLAAKHYLCLFENPDEILALAPDMGVIAELDLPAVIVTAPAAGDADFVSRFFAPANGVPEDPVSGVAHLCLTPYWSKQLGKTKLVGRQLSARGGLVRCEDLGSRVRLGGNAAIFLEARITL
jgi:predicted PhzF superfamily epimerase YddE/YHI9